tara:strand:- start:458 stop:619 length:162 start_codon:yes stop_codon:yes gene_type:complete
MAINVFPNRATAEVAIPYREKFIEDNGFKKDWYIDDEFVQHYVKYRAGKLTPE